mmetsp:Transcript_6657/g.40723  ORF Transcript_6657/g.40723 Transcript_6657/m.40723 type:complete len:153 (-) Transcript_6657:758-1216(-)
MLFSICIRRSYGIILEFSLTAFHLTVCWFSHLSILAPAAWTPKERSAKCRTNLWKDQLLPHFFYESGNDRNACYPTLSFIPQRCNVSVQYLVHLLYLATLPCMCCIGHSDDGIFVCNPSFGNCSRLVPSTAYLAPQFQRYKKVTYTRWLHAM